MLWCEARRVALELSSLFILQSVKQEASSKVAASELQAIVADKDEEIKELRHEGEKLSKQQLQLSTLVKKLRAKEKEMETASKTNKWVSALLSIP
jgi:TATA element modulatory factor